MTPSTGSTTSLDHPADGHREPPDRPAPAPLLFGAVVAASLVVLGWFSRGVFLFSDDYVFLGQAREASWSRDYLTDGLFQHFSPVTRAVNLAVVGSIPASPWVIWVVLMVLAAATVSATTILMLALFGRSWVALVGAALLGPALSLLPLVNWWTAGVNLMPALAGGALCLAGVVSVVRGRSSWWGVVAVLGYAVAVLSWEAATLSAGYAFLWVLLFRARVTTESLRAVLRRTWWIWGLLVTIGALTIWNYRANYYLPAPPAPLGDVLKALVISLFGTLLPSLLGFHGPDNPWLVAIGTIAGILATGWLVAHTLLNRTGAWRGWSFALAGWFLPALALVVNRVGYWGPTVAENVIYFYLPSVLFVVGAAEAWVAPPRRAAGVVARRPVRVVLAVTALVVVVGYLCSTGPTVDGLFESGLQASSGRPDPAYVSRVQRSAAALGGTATVINSDVPHALVPPSFNPYNRLDRVTGVSGPSIRFDGVDGPYVRADASGVLRPVDISWLAGAPVAGRLPDGLQITGVADLAVTGDGACFRTVDAGSRILWQLGQPVSGPGLVVRSQVVVDRPTGARVVVSPAPGADFTAANFDAQQWRPGSSGRLDTVARRAISTVVIDSMSPGAHVCLQGLGVGSVHAVR